MVTKTRLPRTARPALTWTAKALTCVIALSGWGSAFGRSLVNGYYVSKADLGSAAMAHLVEAPRGHLSGALVVTSVALHGSALKVARVTVRGSIANGNVTLSTPGFFGHFRTVYVGTLNGEELTLSRTGRSPFVLRLSSERRYQRHLAVLTASQMEVNTFRNDRRLVQNTIDYVKRLNLGIAQYLVWGRARIAHEVFVRRFWHLRVKGYEKCLTEIQPLAAAGVAEWRWNACAFAVGNDSSNRHQEVWAITEIKRDAAAKRSALLRMLAEAPIKVRAAANVIRAACALYGKPKSCKDNWRQWSALRSDSSLVPAARLAAFRALLPKVDQAIRYDVQITNTTNSRLHTVAARIANILDYPEQYREN